MHSKVCERSFTTGDDKQKFNVLMRRSFVGKFNRPIKLLGLLVSGSERTYTFHITDSELCKVSSTYEQCITSTVSFVVFLYTIKKTKFVVKVVLIKTLKGSQFSNDYCKKHFGMMILT